MYLILDESGDRFVFGGKSGLGDLKKKKKKNGFNV